jgi:hypothetical protein
MKTAAWFLATALALTLAGCGGGSTTAPKADGPTAEEKITQNLATLSDEDRKLAEAQKYCAVDSENRLGGMGKPFQMEIKGEKVFLCCKGCEKEALKDEDTVLAKARQLREKAVKEK